MAAKQTAGESLADRKKPALTPKELDAAAEKVSAAEKFPENFSDSLALYKQLSAEPVGSEDEWLEKQPRLAALKAHVAKIQQGLPVIPASSNDHASVHLFRQAGEQRTKLERLARSLPEVKALLEKCDVLEKQIAELNQKTPE